MWYRGFSQNLIERGRKVAVHATVVTAALVALTGASTAGQTSWIEAARDADAPNGFAGVCARYAWACAKSGRNTSTPRDLMPLAKQVNFSINRQTREVSDEAQYARAEYWALPTARGGDCEDFALAKKRALIAKGVAPERLLIATVLDRQRNPHAVLVLRTDAGDFVLDNLTNRIVGWQQTGYTFLRMQNPKSPNRWSAVLKGGMLGG